jgi:2'-phosphotransferase
MFYCWIKSPVTSPVKQSFLFHPIIVYLNPMDESTRQEEWTTKTSKGHRRRRNRKSNLGGNHKNNTDSYQQSSTSIAGLVNTMNTMTLHNNNDDDDVVSVTEVETSLQQCRNELLQSDFYSSLLAAAGCKTTRGDDDDLHVNNKDDHEEKDEVYASTNKITDIVCYGIGNFFTKRISAPMWQLALALLLRDHYCKHHHSTKAGSSGANDVNVVSISYFEPRITIQEQTFLEQTVHVHVIANNERGCRPVGTKGTTTIFFMPHCPMALYANVLYTNWDSLDKLVIFGNSLSSYVNNSSNGNQTAKDWSTLPRTPQNAERCQSSKKRDHDYEPVSSDTSRKKVNNQNHHNQTGTPKIHNQKLSKALSWALRHNANKIGLTIHQDGYVPVQEILDCKHSKLASLKPTLKDIEEVVHDNDKQRFKLDYRPRHLFQPVEQHDHDEKGDDLILCIRANQGHSMSFIDPNLLLRQLQAEELRSISCIVHGTYHDAWKSIQHQGLSRMNRTHIHFAVGLPNQDHVISGMRASATVYIYVDAVQCANNGITFYESANGVLLSDGINGIIPGKYFSHVTEVSTGNLLLDQRVTTTPMHDDVKDDDTAPTATAWQILKILQPEWKEISIPISRKDTGNRSVNFERAFNDCSLTIFTSKPDGMAPMPRPRRIEGIEECGEII